jgi:hypothetical protein
MLSMAAVAMAQGCYYVISGGWSLVDIESFQKVTGRKTDLWLVKTVGLFLVAIGAGLIVAAARQEFQPGLILVAMGAAGALLGIELVYVARRVISRIYLLDAAIEGGFAAWWVACLVTV